MPFLCRTEILRATGSGDVVELLWWQKFGF